MKKIARGIALVALNVFIIQNAASQANYIPGYVILSSNDTLRGYIDFPKWDSNPDTIFFKEKLNDNVFYYTPMTIKGFMVSGEMYESAIIEVETSPIMTRALQDDAKLNIEIDTTFLQTMVRGSKSLYLYVEKNGKEQFYIKQGLSYELLVYKKYLRAQGMNDLILENKKYIGQLSIYLQDCQKIQKKLQYAEYNKKSLEEQFNSYYDCTQSEMQFQDKVKIKYVKTEKGIISGCSITSLNVSGTDTFKPLVNADYNSSINFTMGLFLDVTTARNNPKFSLYNELVYYSYKINGYYNDFTNDEYYTINRITLGNSYLKINNMLRFKYPIGNLFVYINAGVFNGYPISGTNVRKEDIKYYSTERETKVPAVDEIRKFENGYILGLGSKYKKFSFETRYEIGNNFARNTYLTMSASRFYILLGYSF
jgi:hypothetical protein